jgi:hypothetical protein
MRIPSFSKIDVEGYEREVLRGRVAVILRLSLEANLTAFRSATPECIDMLSSSAPVAGDQRIACTDAFPLVEVSRLANGRRSAIDYPFPPADPC